MDVSQLYMLALRPTMVPIAGESWQEGGIAGVIPTFKGLIELESWSWDFHNQEERKKRDDEEDAFREAGSELENRRNAKINKAFDDELAKLEDTFSAEDLPDRLRNAEAELAKGIADASQAGSLEDMKKKLAALQQEQTQRGLGRTSKELDEKFRDIKKQYDQTMGQYRYTKAETAKQERDADKDRRRKDVAERKSEALRNKNFEFTFTKRVDVSTTQLLNCMKAGDLLPKVTMIMHQSSSNTPWTLVITVSKMRLLKYQLRVEVSDTMTDMREEWTCEFASFGYVYQNRPHAGAKSLMAGGAAQTAAKVATQGTVRTFMMNNMDFF